MTTSIWTVKREVLRQTIHLVQGDWELLSGEHLVILLKMAYLHLKGTLETTQIRMKMSHLVSENKSKNFLLQK